MKRNDTSPVGGDNTAILCLRAKEYGVPFLAAVTDDMLDPALIKDLPVEWARSNLLLPVVIDNKNCLLCSDPDQVNEHEYLSLLLGMDLRLVMAAPEVVSRSIEKCYYSKTDSPVEFMQDFDIAHDRAISSDASDLLRVVEKAPVTQLVNLILLEAVKKKASDIHFEPYESSIRLRYRVDGVLYEQASPPKHLEEALVSRLKVMAHMDISEKRLPQDGMAKVRVGDREIDIRVSTVPVAEGERVVLRLLDKESILFPLDVLGMSDKVLGTFNKLLHESNGIIIVSGPTGSGKTTTLYAALGRLDSSRRNILTIENPVEYQLPDIGQIQVKPKIGLTFASGLRHILRQDPDIILVGETRDMETAEIAIQASLTGHLVFTTLHTNDAPGAVLRLVDMGVEPYLLASCLRGVLAQRLVRRLCPYCRKEAIASDDTVKQFDSIGGNGAGLAGQKVWAPVGCDKCLEGYSGRVGLFEMMNIDGKMQVVIRESNLDVNALNAAAVEAGMITLTHDGLAKILDGTTSISEVVAAIG